MASEFQAGEPRGSGAIVATHPRVHSNLVGLSLPQLAYTVNLRMAWVTDMGGEHPGCHCQELGQETSVHVAGAWVR